MVDIKFIRDKNYFGYEILLKDASQSQLPALKELSDQMDLLMQDKINEIMASLRAKKIRDSYAKKG